MEKPKTPSPMVPKKLSFFHTPFFFIDLLSNFRSTFLLFISSFEYLTPLWSWPHCGLAEQAIRPFTIGRKNFVMIESSNGAKASAILYSLVETAKANLINTFEYFNLLLTEIPQHMDDKDLRFIDALLPWSPRVQKECPSRYKKSWFFNVHTYSIKSVQSPHFSGDFWYPVLMFEDLRLILD